MLNVASQNRCQNGLTPRPVLVKNSHCHLDHTASRVIRDSESCNLRGICQSVPVSESFEVTVEGVVAVFCDPPTYPTENELVSLTLQGAVPVVGVHPRNVMKEEEYLGKIQALLENPLVAGLGEIGLDRSAPRSEWVSQILRLKNLLPLMKPTQVLVLHCRGTQESPVDEALLMLLYVVKAYVPSTQLIHLHCYTGSWELVDEWLESFPNTYFGFTILAADDEEVFSKVDASRILLETDAPYFYPDTLGCRTSTPAMLGVVAGKLACFRRLTWQQLLQIATENAKRLYLSRLAPQE